MTHEELRQPGTPPLESHWQLQPERLPVERSIKIDAPTLILQLPEPSGRIFLLNIMSAKMSDCSQSSRARNKRYGINGDIKPLSLKTVWVCQFRLLLPN
jgi:hypothetical protein